jgi:hypothetical protein
MTTTTAAAVCKRNFGQSCQPGAAAPGCCNGTNVCRANGSGGNTCQEPSLCRTTQGSWCLVGSTNEFLQCCPNSGLTCYDPNDIGLGTCQPPPPCRANGSTCSANTQCCTNFCELGFLGGSTSGFCVNDPRGG